MHGPGLLGYVHLLRLNGRRRGNRIGSNLGARFWPGLGPRLHRSHGAGFLTGLHPRNRRGFQTWFHSGFRAWFRFHGGDGFRARLGTRLRTGNRQGLRTRFLSGRRPDFCPGNREYFRLRGPKHRFGKWLDTGNRLGQAALQRRAVRQWRHHGGRRNWHWLRLHRTRLHGPRQGLFQDFRGLRGGKLHVQHCCRLNGYRTEPRHHGDQQSVHKHGHGERHPEGTILVPNGHRKGENISPVYHGLRHAAQGSARPCTK